MSHRKPCRCRAYALREGEEYYDGEERKHTLSACDDMGPREKLGQRVSDLTRERDAALARVKELEDYIAKYPAQCGYETWDRTGEFIGTCNEMRPCPKHDRAESGPKKAGG